MKKHVLVALILAAFTQGALAQNIPFNNATRDEVTACMSEIKEYHAIRYPIMRAQEDKVWAQWAKENPRKLEIHKKTHDKKLAGESDLYLFAMDDEVGGGGLRVMKSRKDLNESIKDDTKSLENPRDAEDRARASAGLCLSKTRLAGLSGSGRK